MYFTDTLFANEQQSTLSCPKNMAPKFQGQNKKECTGIMA
jgi:hypothetical protein